MHKRLTSEAEIWVYFAVWILDFKIQGPRKSELHWLTPNWTWTLNNQKCFIYTRYLAQALKFGQFCSTTSCFLDTRSSKIGNALNDPKYNSQKYFYIHYLPQRPKVWSASAYDQRFSRYKVAENLKCTEWLKTELEHLTAKTTLYTLKHLALRPKLWSVSLYN